MRLRVPMAVRRFVLLSAVALLAACSPVGQGPAPTSARPSAAGEVLDQPLSHIHGVLRDPATARVVVATHEGAFERRDGAWYGLGEVIDLMGFTIAPDGTWFASGHPGAGTDLPEPVGLIASTDRGRTWQVRSRGGESDFHALAAGPAGLLGYDGMLRTSPDGSGWEEVWIPTPPLALSVEPTSGAVLASTEKGPLLRSTDEVGNWTVLQPPGAVALVDWAEDSTAVGG